MFHYYFRVLDHPLIKGHFNLQFIPQLKIFVELFKESTNLLSDTSYVCHFQRIFQLFRSR